MLSVFFGVVCIPAIYTDMSRDAEVPHLSAICIRCLRNVCASRFIHRPPGLSPRSVTINSCTVNGRYMRGYLVYWRRSHRGLDTEQRGGDGITTSSWKEMSTSLASALLPSNGARRPSPHVRPHEDYAELRPPRRQASVRELLTFLAYPSCQTQEICRSGSL